jgi:hypothetical protein
MKLANQPLLSRTVGALAVAATLALVFAAYLRPGFVLDVANRLWLCF